MKTPVRVAFRGMGPSDDLERLCWQEAQRLVGLCERLSGCDVLIEGCNTAGAPQEFEAHVLLRLPAATVAAKSHGSRGEPAPAVVRSAFRRAARRLLDHLARKRRCRRTSPAP